MKQLTQDVLMCLSVIVLGVINFFNIRSIRKDTKVEPIDEHSCWNCAYYTQIKDLGCAVNPMSEAWQHPTKYNHCKDFEY